MAEVRSHQHAIELVSNKYRIATNKSLRIAFLSSFSLDFFTSLSVAVVAVELGVRLIDGGIGLGAALTILILAPEYFQPVRDLGNDYHATMDGKDAGKQIQRLLTKESRATLDANLSKPIPLWTQESKLMVQNLTKHSDNEDRTILSDVNFELHGYQKVGIIGASGAGKSTLIDLLSGFSLPNKSSITFNGQVLNNFSSKGWLEQVTYIPQPYIFSGTVLKILVFTHLDL